MDDRVAEAAGEIEEQTERLGRIAEQVGSELRKNEKNLDKNFLLDIISRLTEENKEMKHRIRELTHD